MNYGDRVGVSDYASFMSRHNPEFYRQFRPYYPPETFSGFEKRLPESAAGRPFVIADIGCGTGHSAISLLRTGVNTRIIGIDPDPEMIAQARGLLAGTDYHVDFKVGSGEQTTLESATVDGILVGSAFHWMDPQQTKIEFRRILRPKGLIRLFEYQFPKAIKLPTLNEWIRRQFNLFWKAPGQEPRGNFKDLTSIFRTDSEFEMVGEARPEMILPLNAEKLSGLLFSQSRVLHFENELAAFERQKFRDGVLEEITREMKSGVEHDFDFKLAWVEFQKRG